MNLLHKTEELSRFENELLRIQVDRLMRIVVRLNFKNKR
jgi:hypothetical protein